MAAAKGRTRVGVQKSNRVYDEILNRGQYTYDEYKRTKTAAIPHRITFPPEALKLQATSDLNVMIQIDPPTIVKAMKSAKYIVGTCHAFSSLSVKCINM